GIDVLSVIAVGPAVEGAVADRGHIVGNEVRAELVALVHHGPELFRHRLDAEAVRVAQAAGEDAPGPGRPIDLPDGGAVFLGLYAVLGDVAVGADADIELGAVGAGDKALRPVVIYRPAGKRGQHGPPGGDRGLAGPVALAHDRVGVGDIEFVADEGAAEGRIGMVEEDALHLRHAVAVGVAKQGDAVARLVAAAAGRE